MNAERLHAIARVLRDELSETDIVAKVERLHNSVQQIVQQNNPTYQENLAKSLETVYASLINNRSDSFTPAWKQLLAEMGGTNLFGSPLKATIEGIFEKNQITLAIAVKELKSLLNQLKSFAEALDHLVEAFEKFHIGNEDLKPGECEIGMLIPRQAVDNELKEFADELQELTFVLNTFSEIATGKVDKLSIKTISSSDLTVYLLAGLPFCACLAHSIERVVALYKQVLEIRKLRGELRKQGVPDKQAAGIENYANCLMEDGITDLSAEVMKKFYHVQDDGRKNELIIQVRIALNQIANRIDRGYNLEVRVAPLPETPVGDKASKDAASNIQVIQAAAKNMQFMKLEGVPILHLPETTEKPKPEARSPKRKTKKPLDASPKPV